MSLADGVDPGPVPEGPGGLDWVGRGSGGPKALKCDDCDAMVTPSVSGEGTF